MTGGGSQLKEELKPEEEQILNLMSSAAIEGHKGIEESNVAFEFLPVSEAIQGEIVWETITDDHSYAETSAEASNISKLEDINTFSRNSINT